MYLDYTGGMKMAIFTPRSGNLIQNASFESGLSYWQSENAEAANSSPSEGNQSAALTGGVGSLFQIVPLPAIQRSPLFLSFITYGNQEEGTANLTAKVIWLNAELNEIGIGLSAVIPASNIQLARVTFFDVTDTPPLGAFWAKLLFSRSAAESTIYLDLVNLAPVRSINLIQNPSFERGLDGWITEDISTSFASALEGTASASGQLLGVLRQIVPLRPLSIGSAYLLSFSCFAESNIVSLVVRWLNILGMPIGDPAINVSVAAATLGHQDNYLNIVQLTPPAPPCAVAAEIELSYTNELASAPFIDQVLLIRMDSANLLENPGFALGLEGWTSQNVTLLDTNAYVGSNYAGLAEGGALIHQTVALPPLAHSGSFLFNFALHYAGIDADNGLVTAQVLWLDRNCREIGLGASLNILQEVQAKQQWQVYTAFTERAPINAVAARIQFAKSEGAAGTVIGLDSVTFAKVR